MDRNRKILISILALLVFSAVIAIVDISLKMKDTRQKTFNISTPQFGPGVGIVRIEGPIGMSLGRSPLGFAADSDAIIARLDDLSKDGNIKAVVVRINSPGGTVGATQEIYQKIWKLRKKNIPLVASMGEIAASGGYYIASACDTIMANQGTITASIGVIVVAPNLKGLFDKFGIKMNVIKSGRYKDILSSHRDMSSDERELLQEMIDISYRQFLKDVALGRSQNQSDIEPYADGRVMSGETALKYKLIDTLGTFEDALDKAKVKAGLPADAPVYDEAQNPLRELFSSLEGMVNKNQGLEENLHFAETYRLEYRLMP